MYDLRIGRNVSPNILARDRWSVDVLVKVDDRGMRQLNTIALFHQLSTFCAPLGVRDDDDGRWSMFPDPLHSELVAPRGGGHGYDERSSTQNGEMADAQKSLGQIQLRILH